MHVPFCYKKCNYCDFNSYESKEYLYERYFMALEKEVDGYNFTEEVKSIYIGGGTPSIVPPIFIENIIKRLYSKFSVSDVAEITIETNPGTLSLEKLKRYKRVGINRLSIGLQASKQSLLEKLGRCHSLDAFLESFSLAKQVGFDNISVDLMFGVPRQTMQDLENTLDLLLSLSLNHISCYSLKIEDGTVFGELFNKGEIEYLDEDLERKMYYYAKDVFKANGFKHYEISNFAKTGFESVHNNNYWECGEYIGLGAGAHSYYKDLRYSNTSNLEKYISLLENRSDLSERIETNQRIDEDEKRLEFMILGLRKLVGVSDFEFKKRFGESLFDRFGEKIQNLEFDGFVKCDGKRLFLTDKGLDFANKVMADFL